MSHFETSVFPNPPVWVYCIVNGDVYLSHLFSLPRSAPPTYSTKLDPREQWQFYINRCLFIIVLGTFCKFNNLW